MAWSGATTNFRKIKKRRQKISKPEIPPPIIKAKKVLPNKGTHYHEPDQQKLSPEARWIKDNGWSGKQ